MAIYEVNLSELALASANVTVRSFGAIFQNSLFSYRIWAQMQLAPVNKTNPGLASAVDQAIVSACNRTVVLMNGGHEQFVEWLAGQLATISERHEGATVIPVMNQDFKSDAWLTGLVMAKLLGKVAGFDPSSVGYALEGKQAGLCSKTKTVVKKPFVLVLIDDASYSGTQAFALLANSGMCGLFDMGQFKAGYLLLAGISTVAKEKFKEAPIEVVAQCDPMPSGPFGSTAVLNAMRRLPVDTGHSSVTSAGLYALHRELDPNTLQLKPTTGEFPTFTNLSYALPPYKIPDSLSVPVHVYAACGYSNEDDHLPRVMYNARLISRLSHLFQAAGSIDYRTVLPNLSERFAKRIA